MIRPKNRGAEKISLELVQWIHRPGRPAGQQPWPFPGKRSGSAGCHAPRPNQDPAVICPGALTRAAALAFDLMGERAVLGHAPSHAHALAVVAE